MWIPRTVEELERSVEAGDLQETATLDFKAGPTVKSKDLAKDIAAFANYGGVIIFGIGEDEMERPTLLTPFPLGGVVEKIANIARTSLAPPVPLEFIELQRETNDGYVVVVIPESPTAPHQVKIDQDNRYYGRLGKVNIRLEEGEISALHQRRRRWEINLDSIQEDLLQLAPADADKSKSALFLVARPLGNSPILDQAAGQNRKSRILEEIITSSDGRHLFYNSPFCSLKGRPLSDGWLFEGKWDDHLHGSRTLVLRLGRYGTCELFYNEIAIVDNNRRKLIQQNSLVDTTRQFLWIVGAIYRKASFWGAIDLGAMLTGLAGSQLVVRNSVKGQYFDAEQVFKVLRMPAGKLGTDSHEVVRELFSDYYYGLDLDLSETLFSESL